jgi:hypothetical protein
MVLFDPGADLFAELLLGWREAEVHVRRRLLADRPTHALAITISIASR